MKAIISKCTCLVLALMVVLLCAGCSNNEEPQAPTLTADAVLSESNYRLGDTMGDYTVTDINGVSYKFSDILKDKKAIVLNFWFINCGPCRIEFPYMNEAYESFKEDIEILAINPVGDSEADIKAFAEENSLSFPVVTGDTAWNTAMNIQGYPTTVVIDRTGVVSMKHTGYIDSTETFKDIFEFFTKDGYTHTIVNNLSDIK
ncbi:MAG: redoxin domain-containing protein [Ruminococcus sp.]|nr:redoxin domain-containing protein [Ruminococcus sp.]